MVIDKKKNLRLSFKDGAFASAMVGFTQDYFTPFLLVLGGSAREVGFLSSMPNLFGALGQLKIADLSAKMGSRKKVVSLFVLLQSLMLLPIALLAFFAHGPLLLFIVFVTLFTAFGAFAIAPWSSLMSDLVVENQRGKYFGRRNKSLGFIVVGMSFLAGSILHLWKEINVQIGFGIIFLLAFVFRMISWRFFLKMDEPKLVQTHEDFFTLFKFLSRLKESNFAQFVVFVSSMSFSVCLAAPYFAVFMLRDLRFSYVQYSFITITATLTIYLMMSRWGRHADLIGNLRILRLTAPFIGLLPLLWILNQHPVYLFFVQVFSGFVWSGFQLCASNFIFDAVSPTKRTRCISYFNVINGLALCLGALAGGLIAKYLPALGGYRLLSLFVISSIFRLSVSLFMPKNLKEVRSVQEVNDCSLLLSMLGIKPIVETQKVKV